MFIDLKDCHKGSFNRYYQRYLEKIFVLGKAFEDEWGNLAILNDRNEDENNEA